MSFPYGKHQTTEFVHWLWRTSYATACGVSDSFLEEQGEWIDDGNGRKHRDYKHRTEDVAKVTCPYCIDALPELLQSMAADAMRLLRQAQVHEIHINELLLAATKRKGTP